MAGQSDTFRIGSVLATFAAFRLDGWAGDDAINVEPQGEKYEVKRGADGNVLFWASHSKLYKVTFTFLYGSLGAKFMQAVMLADDLTDGGAGEQPCTVIDTKNTLSLLATSARITSGPKPNFKGGEADNLQFVVQGNFDLAFTA